MFRNSVFTAKAPSNPDGQLEKFGGITSAEDGSALKAGPVAGLWNSGHGGFVNVLVDSGASGHYFNDALIPGLRYKLGNSITRCWMYNAKSPPPGDTKWIR